MHQEEWQHRQALIDTVLNYLGEHNDSRCLYEMFHDEMGPSHDDIEELGFDLSDYYPEQDSAELQKNKGVESGGIESVLAVDIDHLDIDPDAINSPAPNIELTMLG